MQDTVSGLENNRTNLINHWRKKAFSSMFFRKAFYILQFLLVYLLILGVWSSRPLLASSYI